MAELLCKSETSLILTWRLRLIDSPLWVKRQPHEYEFQVYCDLSIHLSRCGHIIIALLTAIKKTFVLVCQREYRASIAGFDNCRVKWLIYNAASPVAFAESIVASREKKRK